MVIIPLRSFSYVMNARYTRYTRYTRYIRDASDASYARDASRVKDKVKIW